VITGFHALIYSTDAAADRAFLKDVLGFPYVDDGDGWLIFKLPPSEIGVHPVDGAPRHEVFFMVDDIAATVAQLASQGVTVTSEPTDRGYGIVAVIELPSGAPLEIYQPTHRTAKDL
jgi:catechol 2,3-dioxygenase-like lactoylglutathione lyase family enzyme